MQRSPMKLYQVISNALRLQDREGIDLFWQELAALTLRKIEEQALLCTGPWSPEPSISSGWDPQRSFTISGEISQDTFSTPYTLVVTAQQSLIHPAKFTLACRVEDDLLDLMVQQYEEILEAPWNPIYQPDVKLPLAYDKKAIHMQKSLLPWG